MAARAIALAAFAFAFHFGCSEQEAPPPAPPRAWESWYGPCRCNAVAANSAGEVWAGTDRNGLRHFNGVYWTAYLLENSGIASNRVRDVALDASGRCWVATDRGVSVLDGASFSSLTNASTGGGLPSDDVNCLFLDASGGMWVGTAAGAARWSGTAWQGGFDLAGGLAADAVSAIAEDSSTPRNVWFGHPGAGLTRWNGTSFTPIGTAQGLSNGNVNGIAFDAANVGWFATNNGLNAYSGSFTVYNTANSSLPNNSCRDVSVEPGGRVWVATGAGVASLLTGSWNTYGTANGIYSAQTRAVLALSGTQVWAGCDLGLNWRSGSGWTGNILANVPLSSNTVHEVAFDSSSRVWCSTDYGVTRVSQGNVWEAWSPDNSALSGAVCPCIHVDGNGTAWIGTLLNGLNKFDAAGWQNWVTGSSGIPGNLVSDVAQEAGGALWLATWSGVSRFDGVSSFTNYGTADGLASATVSCVAVDGAGAVWAGTLLSGLSRFGGAPPWTTFTTANGLPSNTINEIAFGHGGIWVATGTGGAAFSGDGGTSWTAHNMASGALPSNDARSIAVSPGGDVYVATWAGLAVRVGTTWTHRTTWNSGLVGDNLNFVTVSPDGKSVYVGTSGAGISIWRPEHAQ
ncbi:MAG: hypothetical protein MUC63_06265 [Planctomycetes bacterium]|nr:hypothetical protein [Planctomycetota bacterium]